MKKILNTIFLATFLFAAACSDGYDDTRIKKDLDDVGQILDELEQAVDGLRTQMDALTQLINSSFVSLISTDAEGNYVITYIDRGGESRTLTLATQKEVVTLPIVGHRQGRGRRVVLAPDLRQRRDLRMDTRGWREGSRRR